MTMDIDKKLDIEMKEAAKAKNKVKLSTIRLIKSALHNKEIDLKKKLEETEILQTFASMVKQRNDSIEQFTKGDRADLVEREQQEIEIIKSFMPDQMSEEEIRAEIAAAVQKVGATAVKDMGKVMKELMPKIMGKADGKVVSEMVKETLSS